MDYFSEQEGYYASHELPSPAGTPYETPVPSASRRSSRFGNSSPHPLSSSPPPLPPDNPRNSHNAVNDESISILDPRRFTPTLHANLVSEILSLRRELDSKHKFIEGLELNLETAKSENETLTRDVTQGRRENRSLKGQLQQLEHGTLSALEQLAKEKDEFKDVNEELKHKLDQAQKRVKTQEDDSERMHIEWSKEKETWDREKGSYERRIHANETRLRIVLEELAAQHAAHEPHGDSEVEDNTMDSGLGNDSDTASIRSRSNSRNEACSRLSRHGRTMSNGSHKSIARPYRFSTLSVNGVDTGHKTNGMSLADELKFDEEEEDLDELELDSDDFPEHEMRARRALESRQSMNQDEKAKRILGLTNDVKSPTTDNLESEASVSFDSSTLRPDSRIEGDTSRSSESAPSRESRDSREGWLKYRGTPSTVYEVESMDTPVSKPQYKDATVQWSRPSSVVYEDKAVDTVVIAPKYVDTGIQFSPPTSPQHSNAPDLVLEPATPDESTHNTDGYEVEANSRRKRVSVSPSTSNLKPASETESTAMVSSSSQTVEQPLSPPDTPKLELQTIPQSLLEPASKVDTASSCTQTDAIEIVKPESELEKLNQLKRAPPPSPISVPSIVISPTLSAPSSPRHPILPPNTRNVGVQASFTSSVPMKSVSVQTESVRSDKRLAKLPPHLLPSAIRSQPGTPEPLEEKDKNTKSNPDQITDKFSGRNPLLQLAQERAASAKAPVDGEIENRYPGNNDNGFIAQNKGEGIRRPFRSSSLFAGFNGGSSDEEDDKDAEASDEESKPPVHATPISSGRALKHSRPFGTPPTPVPEENETVPKSSERGKDKVTPRNSFEKPSRVAKAQRPSAVTRQSSIRRSALIQSGSVAHYQRSRSPSFGSSASTDVRQFPKPPFPVPTRSSSRRIPLSKSEGSQSPTHRPNGVAPGRVNGFRNHARQDSLRKVRSAAVIPRGGRARSRSPPISSRPSESSNIPPMPMDMVTSPHSPLAFPGQMYGHKTQPSTNTVLTGSASVGSSVQSTSVVDAIAAPMVGEWMWKYVRKRKSFGVPESPHDAVDDSGSGVRHKRWVWLSPYERSVMWSSKQPTNGTALLGKTGRKLTIQSVLDVPDNSPPPKMPAGQLVFNRSILILTPARALKFTAVSKERHYLWLTALSFLAHSGNGNHEVEAAAPPQIPQIPTRAPPDIPFQRSQPTFRRSHIRDSVRLAKEKSQPSSHYSGSHTESIPEYGPSHRELSHREPSVDAASPPTVPRYGHSRKRSSTGPRVPPPINTTFRSFSSNQVPQIHSAGLQSTASSDVYGVPPSVPSSIYNPPSVVTSTRASEVSNIGRHNFFDAMGTVRMEAFVAETTKFPNDDSSMMSSMWGNGRKPIARKRGNSQWSGNTSNNEGYRMFEQMGYDPHDPFRGF